ncbi:pectinesterase family protein [Xanthomonas translucens]|uniref:pectinesterase family protein n=1 Tax=Xanthomonas campestris pv. translucens TaxID=343 RepID=UPI0002A7A2CE|nr:acyl-CoA thioesterase [Xanthomonas translucens DAR61454]
MGGGKQTRPPGTARAAAPWVSASCNSARALCIRTQRLAQQRGAAQQPAPSARTASGCPGMRFRCGRATDPIFGDGGGMANAADGSTRYRSVQAAVGTSDSGTVTVRAAQFQARNLAIVNSYVEGTYASSNQSAVALALRGDKAVLENVALTGNQDILLVSAASANKVIRAFFKGGSIEGDTDFIFGSGVAVFSGSSIRYTATRRGAGNGGVIFAPSTRPGSGYGLLAVASSFDAVGGAAANTVSLGRAWDESVGSLSNYVNGSSPNGKVVIRESSLGAHVRKSAPWNAFTVGRPYCSSGCTQSVNRFYEYTNSGAGSAD